MGISPAMKARKNETRDGAATHHANKVADARSPSGVNERVRAEEERPHASYGPSCRAQGNVIAAHRDHERVVCAHVVSKEDILHRQV